MVQAHPLDINILPQQYRPRRITTPVAIAILVTAALLLGLIPAHAALRAAQAQTTKVQARLDRAQMALTQSEVDQGELERLNEQIEQAREQIAQLRTQLATVGEWSPRRSDGISAAARALASPVRIITIAQLGDTFTLTGEADSQAAVLDYARALRSSGKFANVRVLSVVNTDPLTSDVEFSIEMVQ